MRKTSFKLLSASLAVAMTMSSMPYNVLAASPEQTFAQAVQQAQTTTTVPLHNCSSHSDHLCPGTDRGIQTCILAFSDHQTTQPDL